MLRFLSIQNLAVIEAVEVEFAPGLTVLTGETGAGKSMLVEAVGLLLGERASPDLVRTGSELATVQACFDDTEGDELIVRREVAVTGRSRAFLNGTLATTSELRAAGRRLVDLHGQHDHQALLNVETHLGVLDRYAHLETARAATAAAFGEYQRVSRMLRQIEREAAEVRGRIELLAFQLGEIGRAHIRPGEDEQLESERQVLANAERLKRLCDESYDLLYESEQAALATLSQVWKRVGDLAAYDARFAAHLEARDAIKSQLGELATLLRNYGEMLEASPSRLQEIEDRLALLERLKRKYGPTLGDVVTREAALKRELEMLEGAEARQIELSQQQADLRAEFLRVARELSAARRVAAPQLAHDMERELAQLAMERCRWHVAFNAGEIDEEHWSAEGIDQAQFLISPNPGEELRPLARIASGGELSRIMLALKTLASTDQPGKTLVFDEVDAGIGGRVADAVGTKLRRLGERYQVLCITHLPQIAACGDHHLRITKRVKSGRTVTRIESLGHEERVEEIARLIAGQAVTERTRASARELLAVRRQKP